MSDTKVGAVLVVGGGIGGIQASLDLADSGFRVYLVDSDPAIGGVMAKLDKTFPTNDCAMCIMAPKLVTCGRHLNIEIISNSEVLGISGEAGDFSVKVLRKPRFVDIEKCTGCGVCSNKCPIKIKDEYNLSLCDTKNIRIPYPQAVPLAAIIDKKTCIYLTKGKCRVCEKVCTAGAIDFEQKEEEITLRVGGLILAPGFESFSAKGISEYGYGRFHNVITSLEFERILSPTGPERGHIYRPSDRKTPRSIAFIQCVGSRDAKVRNTYCSSVCCMYATKEAVISREHEKNLTATIFYMDMRAYGKDFDKYIDRAKSEFGVRFIRSRVSEVIEERGNGNLRIKYETDEGKISYDEFDLVVLSIGLCPSNKIKQLATRLDIRMNEFGFCDTSELSPIETSKQGIYVCGAFQGPKDIPETVAQASGASCKVSSLLSSSRGTGVVPKEYPKEIDVNNLRPRIGVFICHCGINIGGIVDVPQVVEYVKTLPYVVYAERNLYTCSQDTQEIIKQKIKEHALNRVFVAACSPRTHEPLFQETLREAGLNPYLFEMANIRDQCSWVHMNEPEQATSKAKDLVRMALAKAQRIEPLERVSLPMTPRGLVIGGGLAGMTASLALAEQGFWVCLVEREGELGGNLRHIHYTLEREDIPKYLNSLIEKVRNNDKIQLHLNTTIKQIEGFVGSYKTTLTNEAGDIGFEHGVVIVATGGEKYEPKGEYLYGEDERVITQRQLEERLAEVRSQKSEVRSQNFLNLSSDICHLSSVVMIQCVGSREKSRPYCSRYCCSEAVKNALKIKEISQDIDVYILYRDVRTYGFREEYYKKARENGVIFIRYEEEQKPEVKTDTRSNLKVAVYDPILKERLVIPTDLVVLSAAVIPQNDNKDLARLLKVPLNADGFFLEAHVKLRPVEFATDGVFLAGLCHAPKGISESIAQANAAVSRACTLLSKDYVEAEGQICRVDITKCTACGTCERVCAYKAIEVGMVDERRGINAAKVNEALCKGCGTCASTCRCGALDIGGFTNHQIFLSISTF